MMHRKKLPNRVKRVSPFARFKSLAMKFFALLLILISGILIYPNMTDVLESVAETLELEDYFTLTDIRILNNSKVTNEDVHLKLGNFLESNILLLDLSEVREIITQIPHVKSVIVERDLPNTLVLTIEEEFPEAIYESEGKYHLISRSGKILENANESDIASYLKLEGKNANLYFMPVVSTISSFNKFKNNIDKLIYVKERRWDIKLKNGSIILLPENKERIALELFLDTMPSLLDKSSAYVVDLRLIPDKIFIRAQ